MMWVRRQRQIYSKGTKRMQGLPNEVSGKTKVWHFTKKTKYNLSSTKTFYKDMHKKKKELNGATVSQASAIISRRWKEIIANKNEIGKYSGLLGAQKWWHKEDSQKFKEDHINEVEIIILH